MVDLWDHSHVQHDHQPTPPDDVRASQRVEIDRHDPDPAVLERAGEIIRGGGLVVFPTETVYGLGANALDPVATESIFTAKGRPSSDPLIVHVASARDARELTVSWDERAERLAATFWPGPLTLVMVKSSVVPDAITAGLGTVAVRVPAHPVALGVIRAARCPVAAPSANRFGRISPTTADAVEAELAGRYDMLLDAGHTDVGVESTVVDLSGPVAVVLRPGGVTVEDLESVLDEVRVRTGHSHGEDVGAVAPGQFLRHYSPSTPLIAVRGGGGPLGAVVAALRDRGVRVAVVDLPGRVEAAAVELYERLRSADGTADVIVVGMVEPVGVGRAVNDRLFRASRGHVVDSADPGVIDAIVAMSGHRTGRN